ncbi:MAG: DUF4330 domain-containing protein [Synechococcus sp.]
MAGANRFKAVSWIDGLAGAVALVALMGVVWSPKLSNAMARATGRVKPVVVSVDVRGLSTANKSQLIADALDHGKTSIVIRNQPAGSVRLVAIQDIAFQLTTVLPDGRVIQAVDPNRERQGILEARFVLQGNATVSDTGVVMAGTKLKIGSPVELEGPLYRFNGTVSGVEVE